MAQSLYKRQQNKSSYLFLALLHFYIAKLSHPFFLSAAGTVSYHICHTCAKTQKQTQKAQTQRRRDHGTGIYATGWVHCQNLTFLDLLTQRNPSCRFGRPGDLREEAQETEAPRGRQGAQEAQKGEEAQEEEPESGAWRWSAARRSGLGWSSECYGRHQSGIAGRRSWARSV